MRGVKGKVAIVTGASSGIGQGIAKRLGSEGAKVIVDYVGTPQGAEETERAIQAAGSDGEIVQADVTKMEDVQKLVDVAWQRFGGADILVNNAGMERKSFFLDTPEKDYDQVMAVNLRGPFFLTQAFVRRLRDAKKRGSVVNISSVHEDMVFPGFATYCCSKGALRM
ncbi:MAG: SDR family NAD(P)-dependent oxidoreductase, partial [Candidatus Acidiferrum sp.]